jgi:hypothetical protein
MRSYQSQTNSPTVEAIRTSFGAFDMSPPTSPAEYRLAHAFAERLIGGKNASAATLRRVQELSGASLFLFKENDELAGFVAIILLNERGLKAVLADRFDATRPLSRLVARHDDEPAAAYAWGIAAANHDAAKRMMQALGGAVARAIPHLAFFGRVATDAGRRLVIDRIGFKPVPGSKTGLLWIEALSQREPAAAA